MIHNKLVADTIYLSLIVQLVTTFISLDGLNFDLEEKDNILKHILILEAFVQFIEFGFYLWVVLALKDLRIMTPRRYIDWFITTPTMLISTIIFMEYLKLKEENKTLNFRDFIKDHQQNIIQLVTFNFLMLLSGILGEIGTINKNVSVVIGFIFFYFSFKLIYDNYARHTELGKQLFIFLVICWALYGVAALLKLTPKNTMYNLLDIVSKNFYGLFIYYYITQTGTRSGTFLDFTKRESWIDSV